MAFRDRLLRAGVWLFRWRSYLPLLVLAFLLSQLPGRGQPRDPAWEALCLAIGLAGLAIRVHVAGHAPHGTSGRNTLGQEAAQLNTSGLYSLMRHPLYLGNFLMWMGIVLFLHRSWLVPVVAVVYWLYYWPIIMVEERWLRDSFGRDYLDWASRTPAVVPRPDGWRAPALPFSLRTAVRREYSGLFGLIAVFTVLEIAVHWTRTGRLRLDPVWGTLFGIGLALYLLLRHLKHHTRILHVAGR